MKRKLEDEKCILCEAEGKDINAWYKIEFNGDLIPVCRKHKKQIKGQDFTEVLKDE